MARNTPAREAALAAARERQRAAGKKVSRLKRAGVNVEKLDPRTPAANFDNMSTRDLKSYVNNLNRFVDRKNNYVAGVRGQPIRRETYNAIKTAERQANKLAREYETKFGNIEVAGAGQTIAGRLAELEAKNPFRSTTGKKRTYQERNREARNLNGQEAAEDVLKDLRKMLDPNYLNKQMSTTRRILDQMLKSTADDDVAQAISKLTNNQLNLLVDYTPFMTATEGRYTTQKALNLVEKLRPEDEWMYGEFEDNRKRIVELVDWAKKQPKTSSNDTTSRPTRNRRTRKNK